MKFGPRKPSLKRSIKARTTGKLKRNIKKSVNPLYGKKGMGWVNNPKKAAYNKAYHKTTFSAAPKASKRTRTQSKNSLKYSGIQIKRTKDTFFVFDEEIITRRKWSYWWCLPVFLFFSVDLSAALITTLIAYFIIRRHNKKPEIEIKEVKKKLSDQDIIDLLAELESISEELQYNFNQLNNASTPQSYFEALDEVSELIPMADDIISHHHLPIEFSLGARQGDDDADIEERDVDEFKSLVDESLKYFIRGYYQSCRESAMKLKTETGFNNRMDRNKEELLMYSEYLNNGHLELIEKLWSEAKYLGN